MAAKKMKTPLEIAIASRKRGIERMRAEIVEIRRGAEERIAAIEKRISQKKVLLDALERGAIEP